MLITHPTPRRRFLQKAAAILGPVAACGHAVRTVYAASSAPRQERASVAMASLTDVLVRIRDRNHYLPVSAWLSPEVVEMTGATSESKRRALVSRLLHEHEHYVDIVTKGGDHPGELRLYVGVPHEVKGQLHDEPAAAAKEAQKKKCVTNYICCTWKDGKTECCAKWQCCNLA